MTPTAGQTAGRPCATPGPHSAAPPPGSRYASAELAPDPSAAAKARRLIRDHLARWHMDDLADDAQAIASELAANAIAAVPPGSPGLCLILAIHHRPPELKIIMWDSGPGQPCPANLGDDAETGRGLAIIDHLTGRNWGWWPTPRSGGKVVWAALKAAPAASGDLAARFMPLAPAWPERARHLMPGRAGPRMPHAHARL